MEIHKTLDEARQAAKARKDITCIIEIDHATEGRSYIKAKAPLATLKHALIQKPMPEIARLVAQHDVLTVSEQTAQREKYLRENTVCERCHKQIDGNTAYSQQERACGTKVIAYYCESCRGLLSQIGIGEYTALDEKAASRPTREPYTKEDF